MDATPGTNTVQNPYNGQVMAIFWNNIGNNSRERFERTGNSDDITHSIEAHRKSIEQLQSPTAQRAACLHDMSIALLRRAERLRSTCDLNDALAANLEAISLTPDGQTNKPLYSGLGGLIH